MVTIAVKIFYSVFNVCNASVGLILNPNFCKIKSFVSLCVKLPIRFFLTRVKTIHFNEIEILLFYCRLFIAAWHFFHFLRSLFTEVMFYKMILLDYCITNVR